MNRSLTEKDYVEAATVIGCEVAAVKAAAEVESNGAGFLKNGKPKILFEGHIFDKLTNGKFRNVQDPFGNPISYKSWTKAYYKGGDKEWQRFDCAMKLDANAAIKATSWNKFQILGKRFEECGYASPKDFYEAMHKSEDESLDAFVEYVKAFDLDDELRRKDWAGFARGYNGASYKKNQYDVRLAKAYKFYSKQVSLRPEITPDIVIANTAANLIEDETENISDTVTIKKERPSVFTKVWTSITAAFGALGTLSLSYQSLFDRMAQSIELKQVVFLVIFLGLIAFALWFYDRSRQASNKLNQKKVDAAMSIETNNVEFA